MRKRRVLRRKKRLPTVSIRLVMSTRTRSLLAIVIYSLTQLQLLQQKVFMFVCDRQTRHNSSNKLYSLHCRNRMVESSRSGIGWRLADGGGVEAARRLGRAQDRRWSRVLSGCFSECRENALALNCVCVCLVDVRIRYQNNITRVTQWQRPVPPAAGPSRSRSLVLTTHENT